MLYFTLMYETKRKELLDIKAGSKRGRLHFLQIMMWDGESEIKVISELVLGMFHQTPFIYHFLCTFPCTLDHILIIVSTRFVVRRHHLQEAPFNCNILEKLQMITSACLSHLVWLLFPHWKYNIQLIYASFHWCVCLFKYSIVQYKTFYKFLKRRISLIACVCVFIFFSYTFQLLQTSTWISFSNATKRPINVVQCILQK